MFFTRALPLLLAVVVCGCGVDFDESGAASARLEAANGLMQTPPTPASKAEMEVATKDLRRLLGKMGGIEKKAVARFQQALEQFRKRSGALAAVRHFIRHEAPQPSYQRWRGVYLLGALNDERAAGLLSELAATPLPKPRAASKSPMAEQTKGSSPTSTAHQEAFMIALTAIRSLEGLAEQGSKTAVRELRRLLKSSVVVSRRHSALALHRLKKLRAEDYAVLKQVRLGLKIRELNHDALTKRVRVAPPANASSTPTPFGASASQP